MEYERTTGGAAGCEIPHDPRAHRRIYQSDLCGADHGRSVPDDFYHDYGLLFWGAGPQKRVKREIKGMELSAGIFADGRELSFFGWDPCAGEWRAGGKMLGAYGIFCYNETAEYIYFCGQRAEMKLKIRSEAYLLQRG